MSASVHHRNDRAVICHDGPLTWPACRELVGVLETAVDSYFYSEVELIVSSPGGETGALLHGTTNIRGVKRRDRPPSERYIRRSRSMFGRSTVDVGYFDPTDFGASLEAKTLNRPHPEGGISTEMWLLSRTVGWWRLKSIRVHPDDLSKLSDNLVKGASLSEMRQIIDSRFLSRPTVVRAGDPDDEEMVDGQILALLPDASRLRCAPQSDGSDAARIAAAQRTLARHGHDPGPVDGRMGPRTRAAHRAFQHERGLTPRGQLDDATFEQLAAP